MAMQVPFVNREAQLAQIEALTGEWGTRRVLCIHGPGGIGKTRLLQEVYQRYPTKDTPRLLVAGILDFDDLRWHIPENIGQQIADWLDPPVFEPYLRALMDWRKMEMADVSPQRLTQERLIVNQMFVQCFNGVSARQRVVLLVDTTDTLKETEYVWEYVQSLALQFQNCLLLLAGRNAKYLWQILHPKLSDDVQEMELKPLEPDASAEYLEYKQKQLHLVLDPEIIEKLLLLAGGRPILIDLAVEWLAQDIPLPWLVGRELEELEQLPSAKLKALHQDFERQLVKHIRDLRTPMDRLILTLAHAYPLSQDGIAALLNISQTDAGAVLQEACSLVFIKSLPDEQITLHDEMRRLIEAHIWQEEDAVGDRRQLISRRMASYLAPKVKAMRAEIERLAAQEQRARVVQHAAGELAAFLEREESDRMLRILDFQRVHHLMRVDLGEGCQVFVEAFDEATRAYRFLRRESLVDEVMLYYDKLPWDQKYEVGVRLVKHLSDDAKYQEAHDGVQALLAELPPDEYDRSAYLLIQLANTVIRLGRFQEGIQHFEEALRICQEHQLPVELIGKVENALGWAYRLIGQWDRAIRHYQEAFRQSSIARDTFHVAWSLNNLAYVYYLKGDSPSALTLSQQALDLFQRLGQRRHVATTHSTLGEIRIALGQYQEGLGHYERALAIFDAEADEEWTAIVHHELARAKWHLAFEETETPLERREERLREALQHAERSLKLCEDYKLSKEFPIAYYRVGRVRLDLGELDEAERCFNKSYEWSKELGDDFHLIVNLASLAELAYATGDSNSVKKWAREAEESIRERGLDYPLFYGRILRLLAQAYFDEGDYDRALDDYIEALTQIGRHGGYGKYRFDQELEALRDRISKLPKKIISSWCDRFIERWQADEKRAVEHPEVVTTCFLAKFDLSQDVREERGNSHASK